MTDMNFKSTEYAALLKITCLIEQKIPYFLHTYFSGSLFKNVDRNSTATHFYGRGKGIHLSTMLQQMLALRAKPLQNISYWQEAEISPLPLLLSHAGYSRTFASAEDQHKATQRNNGLVLAAATIQAGQLMEHPPLFQTS